MTSLLYYSSGLSKEDKLAINKSVFENRLAVSKLLKKVHGKGKVIFISSTLVVVIFFSKMGNADAVSLIPMPQDPIMKLDSRIKSVPTNVRLNFQNQVYKMDEGFIKNQEVKQTYLELTENYIANIDTLFELRGGDLNPFTKVFFRILWIWAMGQGYTPTKGFRPGPVNPGFGHPGQIGHTARIAPKLQENPLNRNNPGQGTCRAKQKNQDGTLTREQQRNLLSLDDVIIPEQNVIIRDGQAKYKLKNHGHDFGIQSKLNSKGRFKTEKTAENIQAFEIENLVLNGERIESIYRKGEPDGYGASHFYDPETRKNAIFKKETT